jgi:hypothetical protein
MLLTCSTDRAAALIRFLCSSEAIHGLINAEVGLDVSLVWTSQSGVRMPNPVGKGLTELFRVKYSQKEEKRPYFISVTTALPKPRRMAHLAQTLWGSAG